MSSFSAPPPIPVNIPVLNGNERKYLLEAIDTGWISSEGPFVRRFEELMAQPAFTKQGWYSGEVYPVAERLGRRGLYLPSGLGLTDEQIARVAGAVCDCLTEGRP